MGLYDNLGDKLFYTRGILHMCQCGDNVNVSLLVWRTRYTDTFCSVVDCRFELTLEVQRWTRARSECLPGGPKITVTPLSFTSPSFVCHSQRSKYYVVTNKLGYSWLFSCLPVRLAAAAAAAMSENRTDYFRIVFTPVSSPAPPIYYSRIKANVQSSATLKGSSAKRRDRVPICHS